MKQCLEGKPFLRTYVPFSVTSAANTIDAGNDEDINDPPVDPQPLETVDAEAAEHPECVHAAHNQLVCLAIQSTRTRCPMLSD